MIIIFTLLGNVFLYQHLSNSVANNYYSDCYYVAMMLLQVVTVASFSLLLLSVSNALSRNLYFGLIIGDHDDDGAKIGVEDALTRITDMNLLPNNCMLNYIKLQVQYRLCCLPEANQIIFKLPSCI